MSLWKHVTTIAVLVTLPTLAMALETPKKEEPAESARLESFFQRALEHPGMLRAIRIEASGHVAEDVHFLTLYGRGVGFWNRERQFTLTPEQVKKAIAIVLKHHLCLLPDDIGGEEEEPAFEKQPGPPHKRGANPRFLLRTLVLTAGNLSKTVTQEAEIPEAAPLEKGLAELAALCRKPAAHGVTAKDLEEGLALVAKGVPFREAHHMVGRFVGDCARRGISLEEATLAQMQQSIPLAEEECLQLFDPERSVSARTSTGATAPAQVTRQLAFWRQRIPS